jgi:hypothetical protein
VTPARGSLRTALRRLLATITAAVLAVVVVTGCGSHASATRSGKLTDVSDIAQLRTLFNTHPGAPRLILLASPT